MKLRILGLAMATVSGFPVVGAADTGQSFELLLAQASAGARTGHDVAGYGNTVLVGAPNEDIMGTDSGIAYLIDDGSGAQLGAISPSDGSAGDEFGYAVAFGEAACAVSAWKHDGDAGADDAGAVYIFSPETLDERLKIVAPVPQAGDLFGAALAIDEGMIAIGAPGDDTAGADAGAVYLFDLATGALARKIIATDPSPGAAFGASVALDGGLLVVGAPQAIRLGIRSGAAYTFEVSTGLPLAELVSEGVDAGEEFGCSVAIDLPHIAVGARFDNAKGPFTGSVYMFDALGEPVRRINRDEPATADTFGWSIALQDGLLAVGTPQRINQFGSSGGALLFDAESGIQLQDLKPQQVLSGGAQAGFAVTFTDNEVVVGIPGRPTSNQTDGGSILFFSKPTVTNNEPESVLNATPEQYNRHFASQVLLYENTLIIAAPSDAPHSNDGLGRVFLYDRETGDLIEELPRPGELSIADNFGTAMALSGDLLAIATNARTESNSGKILVYDLSTMELLHTIEAPDPRDRDSFGASVALEGNLLAVGSPLTRLTTDQNHGKVWIYDLETAKLLREIQPSFGIYRRFGTTIALRDGVLAASTSILAFDAAVYLFDVHTGETLHRLSPQATRTYNFGSSLALGGGKVAIGWTAVYEEDEPNDSAFVYDIATGELDGELLPKDGKLGAGFGNAVAIDNGLVLVGARRDDDFGYATGSAYLFDLYTRSQLTKFSNSDPITQEQFGSAVELRQGKAVIGASMANFSTVVPVQGSVRVFDIQPPCPADLNNSGIIDMQDLNILLAKYGAPVTAGVLGDIDNSGVIDLPDLNAVLGAFGNDCP